jgi:hypothetical protein
MNANMKRGMSRLCLLLAVLWVLGMGWYQYQDTKAPEEGSVVFSLNKDTELRIDANGFKQTDKHELQIQRLMLIFLPALALLLVVPVLSWITGGFKAER